MTELRHDDHPLLDERLRAADPALQVSDWTDADTTALLARIDRSEAGSASAVASPARSRRLWTRAGVLVAAAALVVGLVVFPGMGLGRGGATAAASDVLSRAQLAAVDPPARPDQYWKVTTSSITSAVLGEGEFGSPETESALRRVERITWVPVDGSRPTWSVDRTGPYVRQVSGPSLTLPQEDWTTTEIWTSNQPANTGFFDLNLLPRDPAALRVALFTAAIGRGHSREAQVVDDIATMLRAGYADAALRQALFEVLKTIPGIDIVAQDTTLDGRPGVALGLTEESGRARQLIFNTTDGTYIGERFVWGFGIDATLEDAVTRELVDTIDPAIQEEATHYQCATDPQGLMMCRKA